MRNQGNYFYNASGHVVGERSFLTVVHLSVIRPTQSCSARQSRADCETVACNDKCIYDETALHVVKNTRFFLQETKTSTVLTVPVRGDTLNSIRVYETQYLTQYLARYLTPYLTPHLARHRLRHFVQVITALLLVGTSLSGPASAQNLLKMTDQFDQADKEGLTSILSKADQCTRVRDFACAENKLRDARKFPGDNQAKAALKRSEEKLVTEKELVREEQRIAEQQQRQQREEESRQRQAAQRERDAARQAEAEAEEQANLANRVAAAGQAYSQTIRAQAANRAAEQARLQQAQQRQADVAASTARDQQRYAQERAQLDARRTQLAQNQSAASNTTSDTANVQRNTERPAAREPEVQREVTKKASINTGRRAMECVSITRDKEDIGFRNTCGKQIFVVWCGDLKYSKQKCGDGPAGNSYYTHSVNVGPGDIQYARGIGEYHYAACEGGIAFGKDEIRDRPDGSFTCVAR